MPPALQKRHEIELAGEVAEDLRDAVRVVAVAASRDDARQLLTGLLLEADGETLQLTGTDSYRLHRVTLRREFPAGLRAVVPAPWLAKVMPKGRMHPAYRYRLTVTDHDITWHDVQAGETSTKALIAEGDMPYPKVDNVIPGEDAPDLDGSNEVGFNPKYLGDIFKAAGAYTGDIRPLRVRQLDPMKPCRFDVVGGGPSGLGHLMMVLMPVRII